MIEKPPVSSVEKEVTSEELALLLERLSSHNESFPFPGIKESSYIQLKAESEEFPGLATHIDELIKRFEEEGVKVVVDKNGQAYILPFESDDIENDSVFPRHFDIKKEMNDDLKKLIQAGKQRSRSS